MPAPGFPPKPWIRMQDIIALIYLYPFRGLSHLLPVSLLCWLTDRLAPAYARLRGDLVASIRRQMEKSFSGHEMSAPWEVMARSFLARDLRKTIDDLIIRRLSLEQLKERATVLGTRHLDEALSDGNGVIVISGHFHANRLAKYYLRRAGKPIMSIRNRVPGSLAMGKFGNRYVAPVYGRFLSTVIEDEIYVQNKGLGAGILRRLRENGMVNIHIDAPLSTNTVLLEYLNEVWRFPTGFVRLAELTGAPIVPMLCLGNSSGFKVQFKPPIRYTGVSSSNELTGRLESLAAVLESWVLAHPEEWEIWPHKARIVNRNNDEIE